MPSCPLPPLRLPRHRMAEWLVAGPGTAVLAPRGRSAVLAALLLVLVVCEVMQWPFLRQPLANKLSQSLHREVTLDTPFGLRLIGGLRLHSGHLRVGPSGVAGPDEPPLVDARDVALKLRYSDLLAWRRSGELQIKELSVAHIEALLLRDKDGRANWELGDPNAVKDPNAPPPQMPSFDRLTVTDGRLTVRDAPNRLTVAAEFSTDEGSAASGSAATPTSGAASAASVASSASPPPRRARGRTAPRRACACGPPASGATATSRRSLQSSGVLPLADLRAEANPVPVVLRVEVGGARLLLDGQAHDLVHLRGLEGRFEVAGPSLAAAGAPLGVTLPQTGPFKAHGRVSKNGERWGAKVAELAVGDTRLAGDFVYNAARDTPMLTGTLSGARLSLPDLAPAFGAAPRTGAPDTKDDRVDTMRRTEPPPRPANAKVLPQREFDLPSLRAMDADVALNIDRVDLGTVWLEPLTPLAGRLQLSNGLLSVQQLLARSAGGEVRGGLSLDSRPQLPVWKADLRWSGVKLERFIKARDTVNREAGGKAPYLAGSLNGLIDLKGTGRSTAAMLGSLDGSGRMWVRDGSISHLLIELSGIDIAESLGIFVRGDTPLPMRCAVAQFSVKDGDMRSDVGLIDTADTTVSVGGSLSLADEKLDLLLGARPQDFSPLALRTSLHVEGTFASPSIRLEKRPLALRLAAAAALAAVTPPAALLALFDFGDRDKAVCEKAIARLQPGPGPGRDAGASR